MPTQRITFPGSGGMLDARLDSPAGKAVAYALFAHFRHRFAYSVDGVGDGARKVILAGRRFVFGKQFLDDIAEQRMTEKIGRLHCALLILHSPQDETVGIDHASSIYEAAIYPKGFISLDGANHLLTRKQDAEYVASLVSAWVRPYLDPVAETTYPDRELRKVLVSEAHQGTFAQTISIGPHRLSSNEPISYGGDDTGPSRYDLLLASLGACTSMTLRLYARHKQPPLEHVEVELTHRKIHASDCITCETKTGKIDQIDWRIRIDGTLDDAQRRRLLESADRRPVHRALHA